MSRVRPFVLVLAAAVLFVPSAGGSAGSGLVISQVFGGGGNAGAPYANDYVEVFNRGSTPVDVSGWTLQYATAAGTSWSATPLSGTLAPGARYLVQLAGGAEGAPLPAPDATGTTNLSATSGKVALVGATAPLSCGATPGSCAGVGSIADLVGYGTASDYEGSAAAPALSSTTAAVRGSGGCADTNANGADFTAAAPAPRNSATTADPCGASTTPTSSARADATVDVDVQPVLSLALERNALSFGATTSGVTPAPISERVTVISNHTSGYALSVQRTRFAPADLPLALRAAAPGGGVLATPFAGGGLVPIPIAPSASTIGTTSAVSAPEGDVWATAVGFSAPIPAVAPGRYTATLTLVRVRLDPVTQELRDDANDASQWIIWL